MGEAGVTVVWVVEVAGKAVWGRCSRVRRIRSGWETRVRPGCHRCQRLGEGEKGENIEGRYQCWQVSWVVGLR